MYQRKITEREAGQRLDKYLHKLLPEAGSSFLYKMLRKKNIVLNDKKADGSEKLVCEDIISIYFSEETLQKFMGQMPTSAPNQKNKVSIPFTVPILYENEYLLLADKPAGLLTQKAKPQDVSLNEWLTAYLLGQGKITEEDLRTFRPSACNRLDRNTSGIVLCAKTIQGAQMLGELLKSRNLHKYYRLYVKGNISGEKVIDGYLTKNEKTNKVQISAKPSSDASYIKTRYIPVQQESDKTLLEVELITGKSHQIRAHLASTGHPLLGDYKYGDFSWNDKYKRRYHVTHQLLHAYRVVFPELPDVFADISGKTFEAPLPEIFSYIAEKDKN